MVDVAAEGVEDGGVDERQRAAWPAGGEGAGCGGVAVALQAPSADGERRVDKYHRRLSGRGDDQRLDEADARFGGSAWRPRREVQRRDDGSSRIASAVSAGSQIAPDDTPNITTARGPLPSRAGPRAIHGPVQLNVAASATGTSPSPRSASHARCSSRSNGTSPAGAPATCAMKAASVERSVWSGQRGGVTT